MAASSGFRKPFLKKRLERVARSGKSIRMMLARILTAALMIPSMKIYRQAFKPPTQLMVVMPYPSADDMPEPKTPMQAQAANRFCTS